MGLTKESAPFELQDELPQCGNVATKVEILKRFHEHRVIILKQGILLFVANIDLHRSVEEVVQIHRRRGPTAELEVDESHVQWLLIFAVAQHHIVHPVVTVHQCIKISRLGIVNSCGVLHYTFLQLLQFGSIPLTQFGTLPGKVSRHAHRIHKGAKACVWRLKMP